MRSLDGFSFLLTGVHQAPAGRGAETPRDAPGAAAPWAGHAAGQSHTNTQPSYYITMSFHLHNLQDMKMTYKSIYISRITAFDLMHFTDFFFFLNAWNSQELGIELLGYYMYWSLTRTVRRSQRWIGSGFLFSSPFFLSFKGAVESL